MIYSVSTELYLEVAARLAEAIGGGSYFSGSLSFAFGDTECRLTASVIVYRTPAPPFPARRCRRGAPSKNLPAAAPRKGGLIR